MPVHCKYLSTGTTNHHSPVAKRNLLQLGFGAGKARDNKQTPESREEEDHTTEGLQQLSARHSAITEW